MREFVLLGLAPPYVLELTNDDCKQTLFHDVIQAEVKKKLFVCNIVSACLPTRWGRLREYVETPSSNSTMEELMVCVESEWKW